VAGRGRGPQTQPQPKPARSEGVAMNRGEQVFVPWTRRQLLRRLLRRRYEHFRLWLYHFQLWLSRMRLRLMPARVRERHMRRVEAQWRKEFPLAARAIRAAAASHVKDPNVVEQAQSDWLLLANAERPTPAVIAALNRALATEDAVKAAERIALDKKTKVSQ